MHKTVLSTDEASVAKLIVIAPCLALVQIRVWEEPLRQSLGVQHLCHLFTRLFTHCHPQLMVLRCWTACPPAGPHTIPESLWVANWAYNTPDWINTLVDENQVNSLPLEDNRMWVVKPWTSHVFHSQWHFKFSNLLDLLLAAPTRGRHKQFLHWMPFLTQLFHLSGLIYAYMLSS